MFQEKLVHIAIMQKDVKKMAENRGKDFENIIRDNLEKVAGVSVDRLHDQTTGFKGSTNICDIIAYREPNEFYFECKSCHGNTFSFSNLTDNQRDGLYKKSNIPGVMAGVIIWWVDKDVTKFIPITEIIGWINQGYKSVRFDYECGFEIKGKKKRVFFEYDMQSFLDEVQEWIK